MEKDYFKDRPIESTQIDKIKIGMEVYMCNIFVSRYFLLIIITLMKIMRTILLKE